MFAQPVMEKPTTLKSRCHLLLLSSLRPRITSRHNRVCGQLQLHCHRARNAEFQPPGKRHHAIASFQDVRPWKPTKLVPGRTCQRRCSHHPQSTTSGKLVGDRYKRYNRWVNHTAAQNSISRRQSIRLLQSQWDNRQVVLYGRDSGLKRHKSLSQHPICGRRNNTCQNRSSAHHCHFNFIKPTTH